MLSDMVKRALTLRVIVMKVPSIRFSTQIQRTKWSLWSLSLYLLLIVSQGGVASAREHFLVFYHLFFCLTSDTPSCKPGVGLRKSGLICNAEIPCILPSFAQQMSVAGRFQ